MKKNAIKKKKTKIILFNINNDINNQTKDNFLKILMKQRILYQNKIPDNSRFKINPKTIVKIDINKII